MFNILSNFFSSWTKSHLDNTVSAGNYKAIIEARACNIPDNNFSSSLVNETSIRYIATKENPFI